MLHSQKEDLIIAALVKACAHQRNINKGARLHVDIVKRGLLDSPYLACSLISMYAKCGRLEEAQQVHDVLRVRTIVSWNALLSGYVRTGKNQEALNAFEQMQGEGLSPDVVTFTCALKGCGNMQAIDKGKRIHEEIVSRGFLKKDVIVGNALVDMYAKCGILTRAQAVLNELHLQNVVSWNTLITGYVHRGQGDEAMNCYRLMKEKGLSPNAVTFICILKACCGTRSIEKGKEIHNDIKCRDLLHKNILIGTTLMDMYVKWGMLVEAQQVHDELHVRDVVCWNVLIAGFVQQEKAYDAFDCFELMQNEGLVPNIITFTCICKACGSIGVSNKAMQIHHELVTKGHLTSYDTVLGNAMVDMYAKCHMLTEAQQIHDKLHVRSVVSWSSLIAGCCGEERFKEALNCFQQMQDEGLFPDSLVFTHALRACGSIGDIGKGKEIHHEIVTANLLPKHPLLATSLVVMYVKCGEHGKAKQLLKEVALENVGSWNAIIAEYAREEQWGEALECFEMMQQEGVSPNEVTLTCILKACGSMKAMERGEEIHGDMARIGFLERDKMLGTALVAMYAKCGFVTKAERVHERHCVQNVASWNALITGYVGLGQAHQALNSFQKMQTQGHSPNTITYICILKACGNIGAVESGQQIHKEILATPALKENVVLGTALVDMYARCGELPQAELVLEDLPCRNDATWSALIAGYARCGQGNEALNCFCRMQSEGLLPDAITMQCVLNACSHAGLLGEAQACFMGMKGKYGISPNLEHQTSMVAAMGGAGRVEEAMWAMKLLPPFSTAHLPPWRALLSRCRDWGNVEVGAMAFDGLSMGRRHPFRSDDPSPPAPAA